MKPERIFSIASIITFFALLPALIIMEIRVLRIMPNILFVFIIIDILLVAFIGLEIFLVIRKWQKEKDSKEEEQEVETAKEEEIEKEWDEEKATISD
jgi:large-conductance mechanosensitive channel